MSERILHVDIAKGISICLVAMVHTKIAALWPDVVGVGSLFRMPLFFLLAGLFFGWSASPVPFLRHKAEALIKPYFATLLPLLVVAYLSGEEALASKVKGVFYGNGYTILSDWQPMWFLTHLFVLYGFSYLLFRYTPFSRISPGGRWAWLAVFLVLGSYGLSAFWFFELHLPSHTLELPGLPFGIDLLLFTSAFFIAGHLLRDRVAAFVPQPFLLLSALLVLLCVVVFSDALLDVNKRHITQPPLAWAGSVSGIYLILCLSVMIARIDPVARLFVYLGQSSLYILIFHMWLGRKAYMLLEQLLVDVPLELLVIVAYLLSIALPLLIRLVVERSPLLSFFYRPSHRASARSSARCLSP